MSEAALPLAASRCAACGTELAATMLVCPACHALVHRVRLEEIARDAKSAASAGDHALAASLWREALMLLPQGSRQRDAVAQRVDAMTAAQQKAPKTGAAKGPGATILGSIGALAIALLTKGKLLLLGLTKFSTIATMFLSFGVYWAAWGWKFAAAVLGAIYIHEIGHVAELRRRGMAASAPMFIPGVGAFVRMHEHAATPSEDARVGLAGPVWGLGAALAAQGLALATGSKFWSVIAQVTAVINLFNLMPVWQLDGSRGFHALSRMQRWIAAGVIAAAYAVSHEGMLVLVGLVAVVRALEKNVKETHDWRALATYAVLVAAFSALAVK